MKLKKIFLLLSLIVVSSCYEVHTVEGNYVLPDQLNKIVLGMNRNEVFKLIGAPSFKSTLGEDVWFYSYEIYDRRLSFTKKNITDYKTIIISFKDNKISNISERTLLDRKQINLDSATTVNTVAKSNSKIQNVDKFK